jgi:hypothetical protein
MLRLVLAVGMLLLSTTALARPVRVFVVNPRVELRYAATYADYRDKMFALVDASHPRRAELVQPDALDIAAHLRPRDPAAPENALIVFPEDVGLVTGLIGSRGEHARSVTLEDGGSFTAFGDLFTSYEPQISYYTQRYPGLNGIGYLFLAVTDTSYRAFYETFSDLARTYGVYVAASINAPPARRIEASAQPDLVALLRDPDEAATRSYAYEAVAGTAVNALFVFAPDGQIQVVDSDGNTVSSPAQTAGVLRGSLEKAYLTELELGLLGLAFGTVRGLDVLETPVGRLASVISKDAWMIDVNDRYDAKRPDLIIQAEAFDTWGFVVDPWAPDGFKAGGFAQVQRNPSFRFNLTSCLVGNLYEITFDGQGAVIGKRRKPIAAELGDSPTWIGQNADSGFVAVAPWIVDDPGIAQPTLPLAGRRISLVESGRTLLPGSGIPCPTPHGPGPCENGYRESILQVDLSIPDGPTPLRTPSPSTVTAFDAARFPAPPTAGEQRHPRIVARGSDVYVVWQDSRNDFENIFLGVSHDSGQTFTVQRVSDNPDGAVVELRPAIALSPDGSRLFVAWQEFCLGRVDDCGRIKLARFDADGQKIGADQRVDGGGTDAGRWNAALAVDHAGNPLVAWVDERDRSPGGRPLEHIYFSRGRHGGESLSRAVRVDRGAPVPVATELNNKWAPAVAAQRGAFLVAWTDFRNYNWDIYVGRSRTGRRFDLSRRVDDARDQLERIHDHPALAIDTRGTIHAVWADRRRQDPDTDIRYARSSNGGRSFSDSIAVDRAEQNLDPDTDTPSNQWHPAVVVDGADVFVVWQDNRLGDNDIFFARSRDRGASFEVDERVDDSGDDASNQYRPDIAVSDGMLYVTWEDERYGPARVAVTRRTFVRS